jgi:hypothetical protein
MIAVAWRNKAAVFAPLLLASSSVAAEDGTNYSGILVWSLCLVGAILILFLAASWVRRWAKQADEPSGAGFTLGDLRALHRSGKMSTEEYEKAKLAIVSAARAAAERQTKEGVDTPQDLGRFGP